MWFMFFKADFDALITTLRAQTHVISSLFEEGYDFVRPPKFQSDPMERRFSQYRLISEGNVLVSLYEVVDSEKNFYLPFTA